VISLLLKSLSRLWAGPGSWRALLYGSTPRALRKHVWSYTKVLFEVAYRTGHELVFMKGKGDEWYEADCEEGPFCYDLSGPITTVVALRRYVFVSFKTASKVVSSNRETDSHSGRTATTPSLETPKEGGLELCF